MSKRQLSSKKLRELEEEREEEEDEGESLAGGVGSNLVGLTWSYGYRG